MKGGGVGEASGDVAANGGVDCHEGGEGRLSMSAPAANGAVILRWRRWRGSLARATTERGPSWSA